MGFAIVKKRSIIIHIYLVCKENSYFYTNIKSFVKKIQLSIQINNNVIRIFGLLIIRIWHVLTVTARRLALVNGAERNEGRGRNFFDPDGLPESDKAVMSEAWRIFCRPGRNPVGPIECRGTKLGVAVVSRGAESWFKAE